MNTLLFTLAGMSLLFVVAYDIYATVLHASARFGPVGETLNRTVWRAARNIAFKLSRPRRHKLLNAIGPVLLPALVVIYIALLVVAFALIYYPRLHTQFNVSPNAAGSTFADALYFSGITLTTVGYGDIAPRTLAMRFAAMCEAASGFALISLTITYLLSVYGALERKRAVALSLYHQADEGADAAGYIAHHFVSGKFYSIVEASRVAARDLQGLLESHVEHPVIHYFHPVEVYKSLPRMLFLMLESCAILRACLDRDEYAELRNHPEVRTLEASSRYVLRELVVSLNLETREQQTQQAEPSDEETRRWVRRYRQTLRRLSNEGIRTRTDLGAGWEEYRESRREWDFKLHHLASYLGYDWDETTGDRDLDYASDEEKIEPQS